MPSLYAPADAVNRKLRELYARDAGGTNRKLREAWARDSAGTNRKIFSAYDCQAHNISSVVTIDANGRITGEAAWGAEQIFAAFYIKLDHAVSYQPDDILAQMYHNGTTFIWAISANATESGIITNWNSMAASPMQLQVKSNKSGQTDTLYFLADASIGYNGIDTPNGAITVGGIQLNNVEII